MTIQEAKQLSTLLARAGVSFNSGLSGAELALIKDRFRIQFPPDLEQLLRVALPASAGFVHWRQGLAAALVAKQIEGRLNWPLESMLFDVRNNSFWLEEWGEQPADYETKKLVVERCFSAYPTLIPIYSHRYIPASPSIPGNPVYSVYQTDIIYYGNDLASYLANEFKFDLPGNFAALENPSHSIPFWDARAG